MTCQRHYTSATVAELQRIALLTELRRRIREYRASVHPRSYEAAYRYIMLDTFEQWLDELSPVCDNPPACAGTHADRPDDVVSLADRTEGMQP